MAVCSHCLTIFIVVLCMHLGHCFEESCLYPGHNPSSIVKFTVIATSEGRYPAGTIAEYSCEPLATIGEQKVQRKCQSDGTWSGSQLDLNCVVNKCQNESHEQQPCYAFSSGDKCYALYDVIYDTSWDKGSEHCDTTTDTKSLLYNEQDRAVMCEHFCPWLSQIGRSNTSILLLRKPSSTVDKTEWDSEVHDCHYLLCPACKDYSANCGDVSNFWSCKYNISSCGIPARYERTELNLTGTQIGDEAIYFCGAPELETMPTTNRSCLLNGTWSEEAPSCLYKRCALPTNSTNYSLANGTDIYGSWLEQLCDKGQIASSDTRFKRCSSSGEWEGEDLVCAPKSEDPLIVLCQNIEVNIGIMFGIVAAIIIITWVIMGLVLLWQRCNT